MLKVKKTSQVTLNMSNSQKVTDFMEFHAGTSFSTKTANFKENVTATKS